jgi:predicted CoA-binding protein
MGDIEFILRNLRTWAVVGCSPDPRRDSHRIAALLQREGYSVIPVNPEVDEVLGERCHPVLPDGHGIEVVDLFGARARSPAMSTRRSRSAPRRSGCSSACSTTRPPSVPAGPACGWS